MMFRRTVVAVVGVALSVQTASAQCANTVADACAKAKDLFSYLTPQLSGALAGGSAVMGVGSVLGGFGKFAGSVRATVVNGKLPDFGGVGFNTSSAQATNFKMNDQFIPAVTADAQIGIFRGFPVGVTHIGGVDALVSATYLREADFDETSIKLPGGTTKLGFGARIGLLEESLVVPGVSFSYIKRDLPELAVTTSTSVAALGSTAPGSFSLNSLQIKTTAWRINAEKSFALLGVNAGYGMDSYDNSMKASATVSAPAPVGTQTGSVSSAVTMSRTNMFVGASLNLFLFRIVGEYGMISGGDDIATTNKFGEGTAAGRSYYSVGLRVKF